MQSYNPAPVAAHIPQSKPLNGSILISDYNEMAKAGVNVLNNFTSSNCTQLTLSDLETGTECLPPYPGENSIPDINVESPTSY